MDCDISANETSIMCDKNFQTTHNCCVPLKDNQRNKLNSKISIDRSDYLDGFEDQCLH
jgi:hypothetical protein